MVNNVHVHEVKKKIEQVTLFILCIHKLYIMNCVSVKTHLHLSTQ